MSSTNPTLINGFEDVMAHIRKLEEENKKLKEKVEDSFQRGFDAGREEYEVDKEYLDDIEEEKEKLEEENKKLKDFTNWENHPALKHKVVLDDDFYLEHLVDGELIKPEEFTSLKEENKDLKEKLERVTKVRDDFADTCASLNIALEIVGQEVQQDILKEEIDDRVDDRGELDNDKLLKILYEFFNVDEDED